MNGNKILLDTNIILYLLNGDKTLSNILDQSEPFISFVTELELYSFKHLLDFEKNKIDELLAECTIVDINSIIKTATIELKLKSGLKIPDAIIAATAYYLNIPLITSDKQFKKLQDSLQLIIYE